MIELPETEDKLGNSIQKGARVRSYDSAFRDDCYVEGVVEGCVMNRGEKCYRIRVEKRVIVGEDHTDEQVNEFGRTHAHPPLNGTPCIEGPSMTVEVL